MTGTDLATVWRYRWRLLVLLAAGAAMGLGLASVLPKRYVSEVNLRVGRAFSTDIEDSYALAKYLESPAFRARVSRGIGRTVPRGAIGATVIEGGSGPRLSVSYVELLAHGGTAEEAHQLSEAVLKEVLERHRPLYDASIREYSTYQTTLEQQIASIRQEIAAMTVTLERIRQNPTVSAPAIMLLQGQVETRQAQLLQFAKELRDSRLKQAVETQPTAPLGPPSVPDRPQWPARSLFVVAGGLLTLALGTLFLIIQGRSGE